MTTVQAVYELMDRRAPFQMQEPWDNSGLLVGHREAPVERILTCLDITPETIQEAAELGCQLIVSHHPVIFDPVKRAEDGNYTGKRLLLLAENHIAAICCHTCLDACPGGVNDVLAELCGLTDVGQLEQMGTDSQGRPYGIGRVGWLPAPVSLADYLQRLKEALHPNGLRYYDAGRPVERVAVGGGSCGSMLDLAVQAGCDTFVTADLKYDHFLAAKDYGVNLIDAGHYPTENPVMERVTAWLREAFPDVEVLPSRRHREALSYTI
ncbi:MAG: Nif3-like dinuclear metal center hexameric protein [Clostridiales bacterium]|nr:Nif3-like dinuclear metal center hexameric protein [Clostridiales bacterium]